MNRLRCSVALLLFAATAHPADPAKVAHLDLDELAPHPDLEWLRRAKVPTDDAGLVKYLNGLRGPEPDPADVERLVKQLQTGSKAEQDAATAKLIEVGPVAVSALRRHRLGPDAAAAARVRECLAKIEEAHDKPLARPAMRRLVMRWAKSPGVAEALLGYVPFAFDPDAALDAWYGLDELAAKESKVLGVLAGALADKQPARRAVAACILGRRGDAAQKKAVAGLLKDPDAEVRLRTAQGLLAGKDTAGVPVLIDLLTDAGVEVRWQAEELLRCLAVDSAPDAVAGAGDPKSCEACQAAWRKWWMDQGQKADVGAAEKEPRRPLLLLAYDRKGSRCWVVGCDGVTRHEWKGLERLADAQYMPGGGLLTLHEQPVRGKPLLAERDWGGKALWQHDDMADPQYCQRLANGRVFIAERQDIAEPYLKYQIVAPGGHIAATQPKPCSAPAWSHAFRMLDDGRVATSWLNRPPGTGGTRFNTLVEYDPTTDTTRELRPGGAREIGAKVYLESNLDGGYLLSGLAITEVHQYDWDGHMFWTYKVPGLVHAAGLRGRNTIACAGGRLLEISPDRRQVGEVPMAESPTVARPCLGQVRFGFDTFPADADLETDIDYRVRCLKMKDPKARLLALRRLADFRSWGARAIPQVQAHGDDPDPAVRKAIQETLIAIGAEEIPKLVAEAKDTNAERRAAAVNRLGGFRNGPGVLEALLTAAADDDPKVRMAAIRAFGNRDPDPQVRAFYVDLPGSYRARADQIVPTLRQALKDPDDMVRSYAISALSVMGPKATAAVPQLVGILKNNKPEAGAIAAAVTLGRVSNGPPEVVEALYAALKNSKHPRLRIAAAEGLGYLRPVPKRAPEWLIEAYRMPNAKDTKDAADIRSSCLGALRTIRATDPATLELMKQVMSAPSDESQEWVFAAHYLFTIPEERAATLKFMSQWAEQGADRAIQIRAQEHLRQMKLVLKKRQP